MLFRSNTLHVLCNPWRRLFAIDCDFVSDEECVVTSTDIRLKQRFVQLFNVKSGDLLSNLALGYLQPCMLLTRDVMAALPCKRLVAVDQSDTKHGYELIQVRLPEDEDSRKSRW